MNEKEKKIIKTIAKALPLMDDYNKGRFLGYAEGMADSNKKDPEKSFTGNAEKVG